VIPYLVAELVWLFSENLIVKVVISATIRNVETFEVFRKKCGRMPRERRAARERGLTW
jgi:hypothetical protein